MFNLVGHYLSNLERKISVPLCLLLPKKGRVVNAFGQKHIAAHSVDDDVKRELVIELDC